MFNHKVCLVLAALLAVSITMVTAAAVDPPCEDCYGDSMVALIDQYAAKRDCWFNKNHHIMLRLKIANLNAMIESFQAVRKYDNEILPLHCQSQETLKECNTKDVDLMSLCLMDNLKTVVVNYHDQEQCSGKSLPSEYLRLAVKLLFGIFEGWAPIHPDC